MPSGGAGGRPFVCNRREMLALVYLDYVIFTQTLFRRTGISRALGICDRAFFAGILQHFTYRYRLTEIWAKICPLLQSAHEITTGTAVWDLRIDNGHTFHPVHTRRDFSGIVAQTNFGRYSSLCPK